MSKADWANAPCDAQFYAGRFFRKLEGRFSFRFHDDGWHGDGVNGDIEFYRFNFDNFEMRPETPTPEEEEAFKSMEQKQSTESLLSERGERYGDFEQLAETVWIMETALHDLPGMARSTPAHREAAHMIIQKLCRAFNGDPHYIENFRDIAGYAQLVVDILEKKPEATDSKVVYFKMEDI